MRIRKIKINHWRHFENIELNIDNDIGLVCIVGANGTGKSHLLELIAACAHQLGLAQGIEIPRGDPFSDEHDFELQIYVSENVNSRLDQTVREISELQNWDRTLTLVSQNNNRRIIAGGIIDFDQSITLANRIISDLRQSSDVYFLSLDANRAYPKKNINTNDVGQAYETNWEEPEYTRGRSFRPTATLYDEWMKYFLAQEYQASTRFIQEIRRAREDGKSDPTFKDHFSEYKESLRKVLPHLIFTGVNSKQRTLVFDTTGLELSFDQLSGGEKEIAFLIGQIDRFGLREGLLLLDEPELHLNSDLIRAWIAFLSSTVQTGQIWFATHSLEAVEVAGQQATYVLERNVESRKVDSIMRLDSRPILSVLSRAVGSPAFSISQSVFVFIEGEVAINERERFRKLANSPQNLRFIEGGNCKEVVRRVDTIIDLAKETESGIRIGGIVDRDFLSKTEIDELNSKHNVFVLPVHEIENYFLHPNTLQVLLNQHGLDNIKSLDLIRDISDMRAGSWIFQQAFATSNAKSLPDFPEIAKKHAKTLSWQKFEDNQNAIIQSIVDLSGYDDDNKKKLFSILDAIAKSYGRKREEDSLWKICEGKQVLTEVARNVGFSDAEAMLRAAFATWGSDSTQIPNELIALREYLSGL